MKNKIKLCLFLLFITICVIFSGIYGCGLMNKYFAELKAAYRYDKDNGILIKYPSEIVFETNEFLSYENEKTKTVEYQNIFLTLPKRNYDTGKISDYKIAVGYAIYNNKLIFTEIPMQYAPCETFALGDVKDSFIVTIDNENAFLIENLNGSGEPSARKLFDDDNIESLIDKNAIKKLIYAKVMTVSPDGRYILYLSNRDYINSLDIYSYDTQTGTETKLMNFEHKDFLCWEKDSSGNFLFRENITTQTGKIIYSDIYRYSIPNEKEDVFLPIAEKYNTYEMIDGRYIYITEHIGKNNIIYIADIYSKEIFAADAGKYSTVRTVKLSENKEYIAFFGSYLNPVGIAIPEVITVCLETNDIIAHYEQSEDIYFVNSFYWLPDNVLVVNFQNTANLYKDLCRFLKINHKAKTEVLALDKFDIIPIDEK